MDLPISGVDCVIQSRFSSSKITVTPKRFPSLLPALATNGPGIHWFMRLYLLIFPGEEEQRTPFPVAQVLDMAHVECMIASRVNIDNSGNDMGNAAVEQRNSSIEVRKPVDLQSFN